MDAHCKALGVEYKIDVRIQEFGKDELNLHFYDLYTAYYVHETKILTDTVSKPLGIMARYDPRAVAWLGEVARA